MAIVIGNEPKEIIEIRNANVMNKTNIYIIIRQKKKKKLQSKNDYLFCIFYEFHLFL